MGCKPSIFNFTYERQPGEHVLYNTFSKALVVLSDAEKAQYDALAFTDPELENALRENGILIGEQEDEIAFLKYHHYRSKFSKDTLFLTIAPTLDCNFACPYCYENRRQGKMGPEVRDALEKYIREAVEGGVRNLNVTWYGGEPLMYFDVVQDMAARILAISRETGCGLRMDMVTNGYLLNEQIVEELDRIGITKIQITLDGLKERHDTTRPLKSGKGTFDRIFENLKLFEDSPIAVLVRMNVDNRNAADFPRLKAMITALDNPNIELYASPVEDINKDTVNEVSEFMTTDEFESFAVKTCQEGGLDADDFSVMDNRFCFCTSETEWCYVVDDLGDFYKCWDEVGRPEYRCFNLLDPESVNYHQIAKFVAWDPFSDEKCAGCVFLPLCFGGCKFQRAHLEKSVCGFTDLTLRQYIETAFFL